ncbi:MAG: CDP-diacylglycerol--serine O-phosphatidyltransferase [Pseudomonadota bacterium]
MRNKNLKKHRLLAFPISRLFPNMVTIAGLCCGLSSIRLAIEGKFELAIILLVAAAIIDGMDGRIARMLNSTSIFGAHLDSLSDFVCFGVSPALVLYLWKLNTIKGIGWAVVLFFAVCCALRLARFNTNMLDETIAAWQKKFFVGIPSPAGALLALMPLVTTFYMETTIFANASFCVLWLLLIGILMASRVPTFAVKRIIIKHEWVLPIMLFSGIAVVLMLTEPWLMFNVVGILYFFTIPISISVYRKLAKTNATIS